MAVAPPPLQESSEAPLRAPATAPAQGPVRRSRAEAIALRLRGTLPRGRTLPAAAWRVRHRALLTLLWVHVALLPAFGVAQGERPGHAALEALIVGVLALVGTLLDERRRVLASGV